MSQKDENERSHPQKRRDNVRGCNSLFRPPHSRNNAKAKVLLVLDVSPAPSVLSSFSSCNDSWTEWFGLMWIWIWMWVWVALSGLKSTHSPRSYLGNKIMTQLNWKLEMWNVNGEQDTITPSRTRTFCRLFLARSTASYVPRHAHSVFCLRFKLCNFIFASFYVSTPPHFHWPFPNTPDIHSPFPRPQTTLGFVIAACLRLALSPPLSIIQLAFPPSQSISISPLTLRKFPWHFSFNCPSGGFHLLRDTCI